MSFWRRSGQTKIIVDSAGKPINCDECPCDEGVVTDCCNNIPLPTTLFATALDGCSCLPVSTPLVYDALGSDGPGWYSEIIDCDGHDLQVIFRCTTAPQFTAFIRCDALQNGNSDVPDSCSPLEWTASLVADGVCCEGNPVDVVLFITE